MRGPDRIWRIFSGVVYTFSIDDLQEHASMEPENCRLTADWERLKNFLTFVSIPEDT